MTLYGIPYPKSWPSGRLMARLKKQDGATQNLRHHKSKVIASLSGLRLALMRGADVSIQPLQPTAARNFSPRQTQREISPESSGL